MAVVPEIKIDDEDAVVVKICPHLKKACRPRRIEPKIRELKDINLRICKTCVKETPKSEKVAESAQLWLCLACGSLFCGRYDKGHAAKHHEKFGESDCLMWNIESYSCWCYLCDDSILTGPHRNEALVQVQKYWQKHAEGSSVVEFEPNVVETKVIDYKVITPGLQNMGNTCFFNSVVQLLGSIEQLHEIVSPHPFVERSSLEIKSESALTLAFSKVLNEIYSADKEKIVIRPNALFGEIHAKFPRFTKGVQQDAQELLHYLFDGLKADESVQKQDGRPEIKRTRSRRRTTGEEEFELKERVTDKEKKHAWRPSNYIESIFEGRLASIVVCTTCNSISTTYDQFEELSLSIVQEKQSSKERKGRFRAAFEDISRRSRNSLSLTRNTSTRTSASMSRSTSKNESDDGETPAGAQSPRPVRSGFSQSSQVSMSEAVSEEEAEDAAAVEKQLKAHTFSMSEAKNRLISFASTRKPSVENLQHDGSQLSPISPGKVLSNNQPHTPGIPPASLERLQYIQRLLQEPEHQEPKGSLEDSLRDFTTVECLENDNAFACEECAKLLYSKLDPPEDQEMATSPLGANTGKRPSVSAGSMMDVDMPEPSVPIEQRKESEQAPPKHIMRKAYKRFLVSDLPNILILHLKRFQQSGKSIYSSLRKNDAVVSFDEELDMSPYLMPNPSQNTAAQSTRYRCVGAIVHIGTINSGHYVAYFLTHKTVGAGAPLSNEVGSKERQWVFASDAMTRSCSWAEVSKSRAYMIFYERIV